MTSLMAMLFAACTMQCGMHPDHAKAGHGMMAHDKGAHDKAAHDKAAYVSGGIGIDERTAMLAQRADFNLTMSFAIKGSGEYQADVKVQIKDAKGNTVFEHAQAGPLLYVQLPAGHYRVDALARQQPLSQSVTLPASGRRELVFYWPAD